MLLHEFDPAESAIFDPERVFSPVEGMPKVAVSCFSYVTFDRMLALFLDAVQIADLKTASQHYPVYKVKYQDVELALYLSAVARRYASVSRKNSTPWVWRARCSLVPAACWTGTLLIAR